MTSDSRMNLLSGVLYHVWRCATGRPQFVHLADTRVTVNLFKYTLAVTTIMSALIQKPSVGAFVLGILTWLGLVLTLSFILQKDGRSNTLFASALAAMAGVDIGVACINVFLSAPYMTIVVETATACLRGYLMARCYAIFADLPPHIQARGYSLKTSSENRS
jgi:RsiW-degrading membrane proteinase PrsW (M82 family)